MQYQGSCHCGAIHYEISGTQTEGIRCNCSMCSRAGWVLLFVPEAQFKLLGGDTKLQDYQFGKKHIHHPFCKRCGVRAFGWGIGEDGSKTYSINANCLENFDVESLKVSDFDGLAL